MCGGGGGERDRPKDKGSEREAHIVCGCGYDSVRSRPIRVLLQSCSRLADLGAPEERLRSGLAIDQRVFLYSSSTFLETM
ncbi:hypothetical protein DNTS_017042 [Danionella cerebrum]|uniref:Uncharacterized protein n=1 Tax=Danionella cerebrum TaxID=2873325 RepID=A0A553NGT2_9TELE|nr:hypothetical protein DNTS_017042 [Danionella translucida]